MIYALLLSISLFKVVKQHLSCEIELFDGLNYFHGVKVLIQWKSFKNFYSNNLITGRMFPISPPTEPIKYHITLVRSGGLTKADMSILKSTAPLL